MEFVVAKVERRIDRLKRFKVNIDLSFFSLRGQDFPAVDNQTIRWHLIVKLQSLLCGRDGRKNGLAIDAGFNIGRSPLKVLC